MKHCDFCQDSTAAISLSGAWDPDGADRNYCLECWKSRKDQQPNERLETSASLDLVGMLRSVGSVCVVISLIAAYGWLGADQAARTPWDRPPGAHLIWIGIVFFVGVLLSRVKGDEHALL